MFELCIISAEGHHLHRLPLVDGQRLRIGRARDAEVRLDDPAVSRQHAVIVPGAAGRWLLRDTGSTHGCFVQGKRVFEAVLDPGVEVRIGSAMIRIEDVGSRVARELDRILAESESREDVVEIEIIGLEGRRAAHLEDTFVPAHDTRPHGKGLHWFGKHPKGRPEEA